MLGGREREKVGSKSSAVAHHRQLRETCARPCSLYSSSISVREIKLKQKKKSRTIFHLMWSRPAFRSLPTRQRLAGWERRHHAKFPRLLSLSLSHHWRRRRELRHLNTFEFDRGRLGTLSLSTIPPDDEALSEPKIPGLSLQSSLRRRRRRDVITCSTVLSTYVYNIIKTPNYSVLGVVAYI